MRQPLRLFAIVLSALLLLTAIALGVSLVEHSRAKAQQYEVYSAYLSREFAHNAHDWGSGSGLTLAITPETRTVHPFWRRLLAPQPWTFIRTAERSTRTSFRLSGLFSTTLEPRFVLPSSVQYCFMHPEELERLSSDQIDKQFPHYMGAIDLSAVGFNWSHTEALFHINHYCGLCGGGRYVLMKKDNGNWRVVAEQYTWIS